MMAVNPGRHLAAADHDVAPWCYDSRAVPDVPFRQTDSNKK